MSRPYSLALCSVSILTLSLFSACSSDEDTEKNPLTPGTGGTAQANAGSGGSNAGTGGSTNAGSGGGAMGGSNGEAGTTGNIAGQAGTGMGGGNGSSGSGNDGADSGTPPTGEGTPDDGTMSFFVTSRGIGTGGNLGGLAGADAFCRQLAIAADADNAAKTWHAYLSTTTVNARDRIGAGPWRNQAGVIIANNVTQLHDQNPQNGTLNQTWPTNNTMIPLDEQGNQVPSGQPSVLHDILTGTLQDGTVSANNTCSDWTSTQGTAQNGHSNRAGGGQAPMSWSSAHTVGCGEPTNGMNFQQGTVSSGGGRGSFYCFAVITGP